jgi:hypothetical protein
MAGLPEDTRKIEETRLNLPWATNKLLFLVKIVVN